MRSLLTSSALMFWIALGSICFSDSSPVHKLTQHGGPDPVAADEQQSHYPALDLEDTCKQAQNPKCEAIIDRFCIKSCSTQLCAEHGSIRGMCRLMCDAEDLPHECLKMGPSKVANEPFFYPYGQLNSNQTMVPMTQIIPQ